MSGIDSQPFVRIGPDRPTSPVVLSVPHAGRAYRPDLLGAARLPRHLLESLEDRLVDRLVWRAAEAGAAGFVALAPRAEIDLNREEREIDPASVAPPLPSSSVNQSIRSRGGIGLIPTRITGAGPIWTDRITRAELGRRIVEIHRPYHRAIAEALEAARDRFGAAVLLDCHSMPPRGGPAAVVLGDRHGTSCAPDLVEAAAGAAAAAGFRTACNHPYAGGYIVRRHGRPDSSIHALQIEIDRSAYLDLELRAPGPGFSAACTLFANVAAALSARVRDAEWPLAAE